jgi:hypothetical protein
MKRVRSSKSLLKNSANKPSKTPKQNASNKTTYMIANTKVTKEQYNLMTLYMRSLSNAQYNKLVNKMLQNTRGSVIRMPPVLK